MAPPDCTPPKTTGLTTLITCHPPKPKHHHHQNQRIDTPYHRHTQTTTNTRSPNLPVSPVPWPFPPCTRIANKTHPPQHQKPRADNPYHPSQPPTKITHRTKRTTKHHHQTTGLTILITRRQPTTKTSQNGLSAYRPVCYTVYSPRHTAACHTAPYRPSRKAAVLSHRLQRPCGPRLPKHEPGPGAPKGTVLAIPSTQPL